MLERVVALAVVVGAGLYLMQALALPFGATARPGAGFYPVAVATFGLLVGLGATVRAFLAASPARPAREVLEEESPRRARVLGAVGILIAFCLLLPWIGYPLAAFGFVLALLLRLGSHWRGALVGAIASAALSHYVFAVLLDVPLPRGPW